MTFDEVGQKLEPVLEKLCHEYGETERAATNLLFYFNLQEFMLDAKKVCGPIALSRQNWRSVSVVGSNWGYVFETSDDAPQFIAKNVGTFFRKQGLWG